MKKICIEICVISARGLNRKSTILKPQWFAVGWLDSDNKYCTKVDTSGSSNPTWKTKFSILVDQADTKLERLVLTVEVYRREPIFLSERLHGVATIKLQEFLDKYRNDIDNIRSEFEETTSFQLRNKSSGTPKGFVDVSVRIFNEESGTTSTSTAPTEGITYSEQGGITLAIEDGPVYTYPSQPPGNLQTSAQNKIPKQATQPYTYPSQPQPGLYQPPFQPLNNSTTAPLYQAPAPVPGSYVNVAPSRPNGMNSSPGFGLGLGAGALAAGTMIFGDDFLSGTNFPSGIDGASVVVSNDPLF